VVEPHQYAGFSGGVKGVAIGCASSDVIAEMHSLAMLRACQAQVGWVDGNPFQTKLWELVRDLPPITALCMVPGHDEVFMGEARSTFEDAVAVARELHFQWLEHPVSSMLLRVPPPKSANFYQASRAATYVALAESQAIKAGGTLYVEAACPEGVGRGSGERACAEAMRKGVDRLLDELRRDEPPPTRGGAQRAYVLAMALEKVDVTLVGAPEIPELAAMGIGQTADAPDVDLVVDDPFHSVPMASNTHG
jgi:nickel-dependent lactate racemase